MSVQPLRSGVGLILVLGLLITPSMAVWQITDVDHLTESTPISTGYDTQNVLHIAYSDPSENLIKHAWLQGSTWVTEVVGPSAGTKSLSLAFDNEGSPWISYGDGVSFGNLMVAKKTGTAWTSSTVTRGSWGVAGNAGAYSSLAFDRQGNPHIAYTDGSAFANLFYARLNRSIDAWNAERVDTGDSWTAATGFEVALALNDKTEPYIVFIDTHRNIEKLKLVRKIACESVYRIPGLYDRHGICDIHIEDLYAEVPCIMYAMKQSRRPWRTACLDYIPDRDIQVQRGCDLATDSQGHLHISFYGQNIEDHTRYLKYMAAVGSGGNTEIVARMADAPACKTKLPAAYRVRTSIALDTYTIPHISFISQTGDLMYATQTSTGAWGVSPVTSPRVFSHDIALDTDGNPAIAYIQAHDRYRLRVAQWSP